MGANPGSQGERREWMGHSNGVQACPPDATAPGSPFWAAERHGSVPDAQSKPEQGPRVAGGGRGDRWVKFRLGPPARGSAQTKSPTRPPDPPSRHPFPFPTNPPAPQVGAHCLGGDTVPALPHTRWGASAPHLGRGGFRPLYPPPAAMMVMDDTATNATRLKTRQASNVRPQARTIQHGCIRPQAGAPPR